MAATASTDRRCSRGSTPSRWEERYCWRRWEFLCPSEALGFWQDSLPGLTQQPIARQGFRRLRLRAQESLRYNPSSKARRLERRSRSILRINIRCGCVCDVPSASVSALSIIPTEIADRSAPEG